MNAATTVDALLTCDETAATSIVGVDNTVVCTISDEVLTLRAVEASVQPVASGAQTSEKAPLFTGPKVAIVDDASLAVDAVLTTLSVETSVQPVAPGTHTSEKTPPVTGPSVVAPDDANLVVDAVVVVDEVESGLSITPEPSTETPLAELEVVRELDEVVLVTDEATYEASVVPNPFTWTPLSLVVLDWPSDRTIRPVNVSEGRIGPYPISFSNWAVPIRPGSIAWLLDASIVTTRSSLE